MPGNCEAVGCTNHTLMKNKPSFHRFPKDPDRRKKWTNALKKLNRDGSKWTPSTTARICGEHFINGKPNHTDPTHPDYVPSVFKHKKSSDDKNKMSRYNSAVKRRRLRLHSQVTTVHCHSHHDEPSTSGKTTNDDLLPAAEALLNLSFTLPTSPASVPSVSTPMSSSERTMVYDEMNALRAERDLAYAKLKETEEKLEKVYFTAGSVRDNDTKCKCSTGLSWVVFVKTFNYLCDVNNITNQKQFVLSPMDQFFLTLVKLRTGLTFEFLATHVGLGKTTVIDIFWRWTDIMHKNLAFLIRSPDTEAVRKTLPPVFKRLYPRLTCIVDCFEIFIDQPKTLKARAQTYSNYKKHNTIKVFIGCTPLGAISFISTAWGGRVSDVELIKKSGFINSNFHAPRDQILADRGFQVPEDFALEVGAEFIIPAFTKGKKQLSAKEVEVSRRLASVRIHKERVIGALKNRYRILVGPLPINLIKSMKDEAMDVKLAQIDKIITACAALVNLGDGIVYDSKNK